jgi:kynurenine 3-monooxygenase
LSGNLLAILLARHGHKITVYERGVAPEQAAQDGGRSINLALAARGIRALELAGALDAVEPLLLPMPGRIVHGVDRSERFLPYGQFESERIWSVSRQALNQALIEIARNRLDVTYRFEHACVDFDSATLRATVRSKSGDTAIEPRLLLAADGAGSVIRRRLAESGALAAREELLDHGYKELTVPAAPDGGFALTAEGLHIWPRGGFMLIALPNLDRTFTATLFLPHTGRPGFDTITADNVVEFFGQEFPDAVELIPNLAEEFAAHPTGTLGTVYCEPWTLAHDGGHGRAVLLVGDAAHAIVPFHGQGMNAAFEDCAELGRLASSPDPDWAGIALEFESARRDNACAIAEMALENYLEMRDTVRDPAFERRAALSFELERRFPGRFIPRYSMVMFHPEIGYAEAQRRGRIQASILDQALSQSGAEDRLALAAALVERELQPLPDIKPRPPP